VVYCSVCNEDDRVDNTNRWIMFADNQLLPWQL